jgi:hypothetical protein
MKHIDWLATALEDVQAIDEYEEAYEAFENFIGLYLFNEYDGQSAEFTDKDNSVNDAIFDSEYEALESYKMTKFDRLGKSDHANDISRFRIKSWVKTLQDRYDASVDKDKDRPKSAGRIIEFATSLEEVNQDYNILVKVTEKVKKVLDIFDNYNERIVNSNAAMDRTGRMIAELTKYMDSALSVVSCTGSTTRSPKKLTNPKKFKVVALNRVGLSKKTMYALRNETPQFINTLNKYTALMDTMSALVERAKNTKKYDNKQTKSDYKQYKKDIKENKRTMREKSELKYARKSTKDITKEILSITRYLKVLMALEMEKLESLTALYLKVNKKI